MTGGTYVDVGGVPRPRDIRQKSGELGLRRVGEPMEGGGWLMPSDPLTKNLSRHICCHDLKGKGAKSLRWKSDTQYSLRAFSLDVYAGLTRTSVIGHFLILLNERPAFIKMNLT